MKRRLYFLLPNKRLAKQIDRDLLLARIAPKSFGFLADSATGIDDLPPASPLQRSDLGFGIRDGLLTGGLTGATVGLLLYLSGLQLAPELMLVFALLGALFKIWTASLIAVAVPNRQLKAFETRLQEGWILLVVDAPTDRIKEVTELVTSRRPEEVAPGTDSRVPAYGV